MVALKYQNLDGRKTGVAATGEWLTDIYRDTW